MRAKRGNVSDSLYVTFTEFVSADGLVLAPESGKKKLLKNLEYSEIERPIVAQLFGSRPETMAEAAALVEELGFDGLDINMGCPDRNVEKQGAGAALMKNPKLARELIAAARKGVKDRIPVSIKTRLGYNKDELEEWLPELLAEAPAAITVHARTRKEMSKVPARWERIKRAVEIREEQKRTLPALGREDKALGKVVFAPLIIGNGDVIDTYDAKQKCAETCADGAMLGRALFGNPWLFSGQRPTPQERIKALLEHIRLFEQKFRGVKNFTIMKKHFKSYLASLEGSAAMRTSLMAAETAEEAEKILEDFSAAME